MTLRLFGIAAWISIVVGGLGLYYYGVAVVRYLESPLELLDVQQVPCSSMCCSDAPRGRGPM